MKPGPLARLSELCSAYPDLDVPIAHEMTLRARRFMNGVARYRQYPARRPPEAAKVIWQKGSACLRDYAPQAAADTPIVLVVPSLINRFTILDLQPRHSFLRFLAGQGLRPLALDWDMPGEAEKDYSLGDYVTECLVPALDFASSKGSVHVAGYCMGGLLALALAQLRTSQTRSLTLLATPWDFHAGYEAIGMAGQDLESRLTPWLETGDLLSVEIIQAIFAAIQPMHPLHKFTKFAAREADDPEVERFVMTEDWLNDGVPLPVRAARECFGDWGGRNLTAKGEWKVGQQTIDPHRVTVPAYVVIPSRDRIVPQESARPLALALPHATRHEPMMGHVGIMASSQAPHQVWQPLATWLLQH